MPIRLPAQFPAAHRLGEEGIATLTHMRAVTQDIRPLQVIIMNLMPAKVDTEVQLLRLLSNSSIQIESYFLRTVTHNVKYEAEHLDRFYVDFNDIINKKFDAIIITGAPLEQLAFEEVDYWDELVKVINWASNNVFAELFICWGAAAGLYVDFGVEKVNLSEKISGIFQHTKCRMNRLTRGFDDVFNIPHSRYTMPDPQQLNELVEQGKLITLVDSPETSATILTTPHMHKTYILGHLEYDRETLDTEYRRDLRRGINAKIPRNYYPNDDYMETPQFSWRATASLFFGNWIDYVYQETPYDLSKLIPCKF
ncbi:MAG: homoserine O-succinyltransferase [Candidatus Ancillula sp.]|jgi:homoserine O-succinyltransferase|nr:homoserine O-succinyltransferase [Candidatus Ancillula sp.]